MGLYTKAQYEQQSEAVEAEAACISAGIIGADYAGRLVKYIDDLAEIPTYFWARCPVTKKKLEKPGPDVKEVAKVLLTLYNGAPLAGFVSLPNGTRVQTARYYESVIERIRRKLKGKLLFTRMILADGDKRPKCNDPKNHKQPCKCKALTLANLANEAR